MSSPFLRRAAVLAGVAAAYWAAGKLGLLLAIPPGYATAVWPASGIALAALLLWGNGLWPGVALGSFLVNVSTSFDAAGPAAAFRSLWPALSIAMGAAFQALAGAYLVRRFAGVEESLREEGRTIRLLVLGGPVSCLVGATWGIATLWVAGRVTAGVMLSNWGTWWVGDAIGVMIFTPLALLSAATPRGGGRRWAAVAAPLAVTFAVVVGLFVQSSRHEQDRIRRVFERRVDKLAEGLQTGVNEYVGALGSVEAFFAGSKEVERGEFRAFTLSLLKRHPAFQALSWNAWVPREERKAFEARMRRDGAGGGPILEIGPEGFLTRAGDRPEYFPVTFIEPLERNRRALGFDAASDPERRETLDRSRRTGLAAATPPVDLVQTEERRSGILIFVPLYRSASRPGEAFAGYAVGVFSIARLLDDRLGRQEAEDIAVAVFDDLSGGAPLWGWSPPEAAFRKEAVVDVAGRPWRVRFSAPATYLLTHRSSHSWWLLAGGLLFTGVLGALLLVITGRTARVEEEVRRRTVELRAVNRELGDFAHVVSHDLKAPLRGIASLAQWLKQDEADRLSAQGREQIDMLLGRVRRMGDLIDGILRYARVGREGEETEDVDLSALVPGVADLVAPPAHVAVEVAPGLPVVRGVRVRLQQVFQNLISNAVKYMDKPAGRVRVSCAAEAGSWRFTVEDNGPGIEERHFERIFQVFQTLQPRDQRESTGVGLAIVKKVVQNAGGRVWVDSRPGEGSRFHFTWPRKPACVPAGRPAPVEAAA